MSQSRRMSFAESVANVAIGYGVAVTSQVIVFPWFGINVPLSSNLGIGFVFTAISLGRSYLLRRVFNRHQSTKLSPVALDDNKRIERH